MQISRLTGNAALDLPTRTRTSSSAPAGLILVETTVRDLRQGMEEVARLYQRRDRERAELAAALASKTADKGAAERSWSWNADGTRSAAANAAGERAANRGNEISARRAVSAYDRARVSTGDGEPRVARPDDAGAGAPPPRTPRITARAL